MTEFRAILLAVGAVFVVGLAVGGILAALHANAGLLLIVFIASLWIGADAAVRVERRYDKRSQR